MPSLLFLVEDEFLVREMLEAALDDAGYAVRSVGTGREALALLDAQGESFDALITDVNLGDVSGWEVARHARELKPALPVIYCTGDGAAEWAAMGVPNSVLIEKPFAPAQIITAVSSLLVVTDVKGIG